MDKFSSQLSESYSNLIEKMQDLLNGLILQIPNILIALIIGIIGYFLTSLVTRLSKKAASKFTSKKTVLNVIANLATALFGLVVIFIMLSVLQLDSTINKILATAGVLGLAVGLALQDPMNNLFSGVFMSVRELYNIGDLVETNGYFGTIAKIDLRATKLMLPSGEEVIIPNKEVIQNPLKNFSSSKERRVTLECGVSYGDDLLKVKKIALETISNLNNVNANRAIDFMYTEFGGSSINFKVRYWLKDPSLKEFLIEKSDGIIALKQAFDKHDISIPFPITTLDFGIRGGVKLNEMLQIQTAKNGTS